MARGPKSHHADGTPKKRWTAEQRAARGRPPRRRGGGRKPATRGDVHRDGGARPSNNKPATNKPATQRDTAHIGQRREGRNRKPATRGNNPDQMTWSATTLAPAEGVVSGFTQLGVHDAIVGVLAAEGITQPFPIQEATIRDAMQGRDVLGRARTGSGKTLAFGLPLLTRLVAGHGAGSRKAGPQAVILSPTRELARQIADDLAPLAAAVDLKLTLVAGGMSYAPQIKAFTRGIDVVVATPGRLIDLMEQGVADLSFVETTVLDEADHMAEMGFIDEVTAILDATRPHSQRLLFSATLDAAVERIVRDYLDDPSVHEIDTARGSVTAMTHLLLHTKPHDKNAVTAELAARAGRTVVFVRTQRGAERVAGQLRNVGVMAGALHGGLTQGARTRVLAAFKTGDVPVLVATDVAARGIHVDDVSLVVQADPPRDAKDYLHRAGRTARAGAAGAVATITLPHQRKMMRRILGQAGVQATTLDAHPGDARVAGHTGAQPVPGTPISERSYQELVAPKPPRRHAPRGRNTRRSTRQPRRGR